MKINYLLRLVSIIFILIFLSLLLPDPQILTAIADDNGTLLRNMTKSNSRSICSPIVGVPSVLGTENNTDVLCVEQLLNRCQPFKVLLMYTTGSINLAIEGLSVDLKCSIQLTQEIEMGQSNIRCLIPPVQISNWSNWKRGDGLDAIDEISTYCRYIK
jgi:hypothetical protein